MYTVRNSTPDEIDEHNKIVRAGNVLVIKSCTVRVKNTYHELKAGTFSIRMGFGECEFIFLDTDGIELSVNIIDIAKNPKYYLPITLKEYRKLKLNKINGASN